MNMDFVFMQKMNHLLNFCILEILDWNLIMLLEKLELVKRILKLLLLMTTGYSRKIKSFTIYGTLLQYNYEMGMKYNLHPEEYYDKFPKNHASGIKIKNKIKGNN